MICLKCGNEGQKCSADTSHSNTVTHNVLLRTGSPSRESTAEMSDLLVINLKYQNVLEAENLLVPALF